MEQQILQRLDLVRIVALLILIVILVVVQSVEDHVVRHVVRHVLHKCFAASRAGHVFDVKRGAKLMGARVAPPHWQPTTQVSAVGRVSPKREEGRLLKSWATCRRDRYAWPTHNFAAIKCMACDLSHDSYEVRSARPKRHLPLPRNESAKEETRWRAVL